MSAGTLTFRQGKTREPGENDFTGPNGTYPFVLIRVTAPYEGDSSFTKTGKQMYRDWTFAVDDPNRQYGDGQQDGRIMEIRTSNSNSDKSKQFEIVAALIGRNPAYGAPVDIDTHLVGRGALGSVLTNESEYPYIDKLIAAPRPAQAAAAPKAAAQSEPAAPAAGEDGLPF